MPNQPPSPQAAQLAELDAEIAQTTELRDAWAAHCGNSISIKEEVERDPRTGLRIKTVPAHMIYRPEGSLSHRAHDGSLPRDERLAAGRELRAAQGTHSGLASRVRELQLERARIAEGRPPKRQSVVELIRMRPERAGLPGERRGGTAILEIADSRDPATRGLSHWGNTDAPA